MISINQKMQSLFSKISAVWILRIFLGLMYLYSGIDIVAHPTAWYWAIRPLPAFFQQGINIIGIDSFLSLHGAVEIVLALVLLLWFSPRWLVRLVAVWSALEMAAILVFTGIDAITFRDIGLLGASLSLARLLLAKQPTEQT